LFVSSCATAQIPVTLPGTLITDGAAFGCEFLATFFLVITWLSVSANERLRDALPIIIGKVVCVNVLTTGYLSGSSMNPARSFGPAVVSGNMQSHHIYWLGPICGALFAALFHFLFISTSLAATAVSRPVYNSFVTIHNSIVLYGRTKNGAPIRKMFVEFVATLILVVCAGFIFNSLGNPTLRRLDIRFRDSQVEDLICFCLVGGLSKSVLVAVFGPYSGGYFTPAVTIAALVAGRFDGSSMLAFGYIVAQCLGSILACAFLLLLPPFKETNRNQIPTTEPGTDVTTMNAFGAEIFVTFILVSTHRFATARAHF
jgi:glycerol uptake facilitator-like aquaporin